MSPRWLAFDAHLWRPQTTTIHAQRHYSERSRPDTFSTVDLTYPTYPSRSRWLLGQVVPLVGELVYPITLGLTAPIVFALTGYSLSVWRYYPYGVLVAIAPLIGEWLWQNDLAAHHGYPVAFGGVAVIMLTTGIARLLTIIRDHPLPANPQGHLNP